jgi:sugar/nucleoside kinase (ribokinase family)
MYDIAAIGEPVIDFEETGQADRPEFRANAGGGSLNVLAAAAAQGGSTAMLGCVGNDIFGKYLISAISAHHIDVSGVKLSNARNTGIGFVSLSKEGERSFLLYRDNTSPVDFYLSEDAPIIESAKILHYTSVSLAGKPGRVSTLRAVACAEQLAKPLSFDANYRPAMWESEEEARQVIGQEASRASVVKMDDREAKLITGESEIEKAARCVLERGAQLACITLGKEGSYYAFSGGAGYCGSVAVQAVDTTGCGDAFMGTLLYGLLEHREKLDVGSFTNEQMRRVVERANIAGALCSLKKGAVDCMPGREELERAVQDFEK